MRTKWLAVIGDIVLVGLVISGAAWLFYVGTAPAAWTTDRPLLPLGTEWTRILIVATAVGIVAGLVVAAVAPRVRARIVGGDAIRYTGYERLVHWTLAIGFVLDLATAAWILRWVGLETSPEILPALYTVHFVGASLIVLGAGAFATSSRVRGQDALFPRWRDVSPAIARLFGYLGIYGEPGVLGLRWPAGWQPGTRRFLASLGIHEQREGKFLAAEKVLSFAPLAIVSLAVIGTGLVKSAKYFFGVPPDVLAWATWLHGLSTWGVLIVVGAHILAIVLVPRNRAGIRAMLTGRIPLRAVEHEFPAWADELRRGEVPQRTGERVPVHSTPAD